MNPTAIPANAPASQLLPEATRLGPVHLAVTDADRARTFWTRAVGLTVIVEDDSTISLGAGGETLIVLYPGASGPVVGRRTGLYHVAIHLPTRKDLAILTYRLYALRYPNSPTDHLVSETTYFSDQDGNGIEITFETPHRGEMVVQSNGQFGGITADGQPHSGREAVDLESLFGELSEGDSLETPLPAGTRVGHVHLHVNNLDQAVAFYRDVVGFRPLMSMPVIGMTDFGLDRITVPHALALNTWSGEGALPAPEGTSGLRYFTLDLPAATDLDALAGRLRAAGHPFEQEGTTLTVLDPARNRLHVTMQAN
jgi:catechol 2,3-dioxygenase